ncbi:uncharacterized protein BDZ99DRAFT_84332 [Mytilinidion resinicola]|uniref:Uncharacterized protein n=1 Tax=Mytilinidion resinicola TaxID=574789 RepID=A0A6A6YDW9_9PEZI|nr:uncharacterized protein BDZ99DRAFT_84332 [Mytilinidion resinicola]KAF2806723.1 hypothetical protein BDZ99DRAFT_84332 [Mytilinidion resinicola]
MKCVSGTTVALFKTEYRRKREDQGIGERNGGENECQVAASNLGGARPAFSLIFGLISAAISRPSNASYTQLGVYALVLSFLRILVAVEVVFTVAGFFKDGSAQMVVSIVHVQPLCKQRYSPCSTDTATAPSWSSLAVSALDSASDAAEEAADSRSSFTEAALETAEDRLEAASEAAADLAEAATEADLETTFCWPLLAVASPSAVAVISGLSSICCSFVGSSFVPVALSAASGSAGGEAGLISLTATSASESATATLASAPFSVVTVISAGGAVSAV